MCCAMTSSSENYCISDIAQENCRSTLCTLTLKKLSILSLIRTPLRLQALVNLHHGGAISSFGYGSSLNGCLHYTYFQSRQFTRLPVSSGVRQGWVFLGPLLFLVFISDLPLSIAHTNCYLLLMTLSLCIELRQVTVSIIFSNLTFTTYLYGVHYGTYH